MELTTHKLRISQSTVNTILSRAQGITKVFFCPPVRMK